MIQLQLLQKIGVLAISVLLGYAYYFFMSEEKKQFKWKNGNLLVSQLMNFIICLWISKVLIHVRTFFHDPLAVLAYPSDAKAFYMANGLMLMYILWLSGRKKWQTMSFMPVFVPAFLAASFIFECIQILTKQQYRWEYASILLLLILAHLFLHERIKANVLLSVLMTCWSIGQLLLLLINPYATIFGFVISGWYFGLTAAVSGLLTIYYAWTALDKHD